MWAGGSFFFPPALWKSDEGITIGGEATASSRVINVAKKGFVDKDGKDGQNPMIFLKQELEYRNKECEKAQVIERRSHVYLPTYLQANSRAIKMRECDLLQLRILPFH